MAQDIDGVSVTEIEDVSKENIERQKRNNQKMSLAEADGKETLIQSELRRHVRS